MTAISQTPLITGCWYYQYLPRHVSIPRRLFSISWWSVALNMIQVARGISILSARLPPYFFTWPSKKIIKLFYSSKDNYIFVQTENLKFKYFLYLSLLSTYSTDTWRPSYWDTGDMSLWETDMLWTRLVWRNVRIVKLRNSSSLLACPPDSVHILWWSSELKLSATREISKWLE